MAVINALTQGWVTFLVALAVGALYLAGSPHLHPAKQVGLDETAGSVRTLSLDHESEMLAATLLDGTVRRWRVEGGRDRAESGGPAVPGKVASFSPDGATLAIGGESTLTLWETAKGEPRPMIRTDSGFTIALAFSRDGGTLAVAGDRGVTFWDTASAHERAGLRLRPAPREVIGLAFAPDGRYLATGGRDGCVRIWDLGTGVESVVVKAHGSNVTSLAFSDDGRILASASHSERIARLWDVATGRPLYSLRGHSAVVLSVVFAPGGRGLATAASDGTVRLWDVTSGREQTTLRCNGIGAQVIAFSPDGRSLCAGGNESMIWVWDVSRITASW